MTPNELIQANLDLVAERAPDLTARFYEKLFTLYPELQPLFGRNSREKQQEMLLAALVAVVDHLDDAAWLEGTLRALGARHFAYGVTDEMYPMVADAMLRTLEAASGDAWNEDVKAAWTGALTFVAEQMMVGSRMEAEAVAAE